MISEYRTRALNWRHFDILKFIFSDSAAESGAQAKKQNHGKKQQSAQTDD